MLNQNKDLQHLLAADPCPAGAVRAIVIFRDTTEIRWLRFLKRGFRHCAVLVESDIGWVLCDPLSHKTVIKQIFIEDSQEIVDRLAAAGLHAIETVLQNPPRRVAPFMPTTCVEGVKRVLGIHTCWIVTPWQLYRHLMRGSKNMLDNQPNKEY